MNERKTEITHENRRKQEENIRSGYLEDLFSPKMMFSVLYGFILCDMTDKNVHKDIKADICLRLDRLKYSSINLSSI